MIQSKPITKGFSENGHRHKISVEVIFGMPSKDCRFTGICRIDPDHTFMKRDKSCSSAKALIYKGKNDGLTFQFQKKGMLLETMEKYFGSGSFVVLEDFKMPGFVLKSVELTDYCIVIGVYGIVEMEDCFRIQFG